jgi:alpha-ribazole phosphatase
MALILVRHTRVDLPAGTCYGQADVPLLQPHDPPFDGVGQRLRALLARIGAQTRVGAVVCSPLSRARLLAQHLAADHGQAVAVDPRWMELHFGAWEGRRWDDIPRVESDPWAADTHHRAPPGGETQNALIARVQAALAALHAPPASLARRCWWWPMPGPCAWRWARPRAGWPRPTRSRRRCPWTSAA